MSTPTAPPTAAALLAALGRLPAGTPRRVALLHLATPLDVVGGIGVTFADGRYGYRGFTRAGHGDDAVSIAGDVLAVVRAGHRAGDVYLDLDADPHRWLKVLRSGTRQVAFGADVLLGAPLVTLSADVPAAQAAELAADAIRAAAAGELRAGAELRAGGTRVRATVGDGLVCLDTADAVDLPEPWADRRGAAVHAATVGTSLATLLEAEQMTLAATGSRFPGAEDFEVALTLPDGWSAVVPVTVTPGAELVGVDADQVLSAPEQPLPAGFAWEGRALWDDAAVGWHERAGLSVLLRRAH